ncbi:MAG: pilus assembly protein PilM [Planctomycetaceae bacterium]|nr:pilus assembly protein PilM [Planctomycetaceae bacterium]
MASAVKGVWAIDIGSNALKALRMHQGANGLEVLDFAYLEHSKNLSSGEVQAAEREQIISDTIHRFMEEKDLSQEEVAISIAGQNSFARFIKLPPVEPKKIPEIIQFEAVQQIPFDINEVEWDWQLMETEGSPDKEVGLFAIKNELIAEVMDHFTKGNVRVSCVQIAPMALYNYAYYDLKEVTESPRKATVILDMGAENTTLVICTKDSVWQRSIRIGGNTFTQAIADAFRKSFETAEKLKRTAPMSKYMRQIYTAMKPVYTDLGGEVQRSLGFYSSSPQGRDKTLTRIIAVGGGLKLQGLAKYLTQTLGMQVIKPDSFERLALAPELSAAKFHENVSDFGVVYGLGAQLLGEARIRTNLLPRKIARAMAWTRKARMFTVAAAILMVVMLLGVAKAFRDKSVYQRHAAERQQIQAVLSQVQEIKSAVSEQEGRQQPLTAQIDKQKDFFKYRQIVPLFIESVIKCLPSKDNMPSQKELWDAFEQGNVEVIKSVPRPERKQMFVTRFAVEYAGDVEKAAFPQLVNKFERGFGGPRAPVMGPQMDMMMMEGMPMMPGGEGPSISPDGLPMAPAEAPSAGFTVTIEGYSPYKNIAELLDPPRAGDDQTRWGLITRLGNVAKLFPGSAFELYKKSDIKHFKVETGLVDPQDKNMPAGIGISRQVERVPAQIAQQNSRRDVQPEMMMMPEFGFEGGAVSRTQYVTTETVLIDPMTDEEISKTFDIYTQKDLDADPKLTPRDLGRKKMTSYGNEQFITRDYWFRIQAKFVWKDAPKDPMAAIQSSMM